MLAGDNADTFSIALIAHDNCKQALVGWVEKHRKLVQDCKLYATGTTGRLITDRTGLSVTSVKSGPLGGDQQIGALIAEQCVHMLVFFWDPLEPMPHDPDIRALLRLATLWNIPSACNEATADYLVTSPCFGKRSSGLPDFSAWNDRKI